MRRLLIALVLCALTCSTNGAFQEDASRRSADSCSARKDVAGPCFKVRGRLRAYGTPPNCRIWPVGSSRLLGVADSANLPNNVACGVGFEVYADYMVCPLTPARATGIQMVCVSKANNIRASEIK